MILFFALASFAIAADEYVPLAPLPIQGGKTAKTEDLFSTYIQGYFKFGIALAGALAVIEIIIGGIQYMGTESISNKGDASDRIKNAVLGLLLALGAWLILNTINPKLVNFNLNIDKATPTPTPIIP